MPTPGVIEYPTALDTTLSLIEVLNNASSTLTGNISVGDLLIPIADPGKFPDSGIATLTDHLTTPTKIEIFVYTSKSGNNLVVPPGGRGAQGTTAQAFNTGHFVEQRPTARHHTVLADVLLAIEAKLGIGADTPGAAVEALMSNGAGASLWRAITGADVANVVRTDLAALQTLISSLTINGALRVATGNPGIVIDDGVSANDVTIFIDGNNIFVMGVAGIAGFLTANLGTRVVTFDQIPLLPGATPTTANQAARKQYVDDRKTWWSMNWFIADPSTFPLGSFNLAQKVAIPFTDGAPQTFTATEMWILYNSGSASGSFEITIRKHPFNNQGAQTDLGVINVDPGSVGARSVNNITNHTFAAADYVYPILTARSSPQQRDVNIALIGYQHPTS